MHAKLFSIKKIKTERGSIFTLLSIENDQHFLLVPKAENAAESDSLQKESEAVLKNLPSGTKVLFQPVNNVYLVSSSAMDLIVAINALPAVSFSATKEKDWYVKEAASAMKEGKILYAGKYSAPDYELLLGGDASLAIQNTMIYHKPDVMEKLSQLGIVNLVEKSVYEKSPLGRLEWIKVYGLLFGKEEEAEAYFNGQIEKLKPLLTLPDSAASTSEGKKKRPLAAFFYITKNGQVNVRLPDDYIPQMIEMAGADYFYRGSSQNIQMEEFFSLAKDADILIYNATVDLPPESKEELLRKNELFSDFKAFKNDQLYFTSRDFFQKTTAISQFIEDVKAIVQKNSMDSKDFSDDNLIYVRKIKGSH